MNTIERQKDILSIISKLDISPTMFKNAKEKYEAITKFLTNYGVEADMYPQGSFAFGTVIRPFSKTEVANYDLDFICQVKGSRSEWKPSELRQSLEDALASSNIYGGKLVVEKECFTIEYADINGIGFTIDIVPAVDESYDNKINLLKKSINPELIPKSIAIPLHNGERNYSWITSNPRGFRDWFDLINKPFLDVSSNNYRQILFEANTSIYSSVEDVPQELERSALQRVIQILKYHRDVFYSHFSNGNDLKPISAILNTIVAKIAANYKYDCSVFELLEFVIDELDSYVQAKDSTFREFELKYTNYKVLSHTNGKWDIPNPANPDDNLANKWNQNSDIPKYFFRWVSTVKKDFVESLQNSNDQQFRVMLENGLGANVVSSVLGSKYNIISQSEPINVATAAKPYRCI